MTRTKKPIYPWKRDYTKKLNELSSLLNNPAQFKTIKDFICPACAIEGRYNPYCYYWTLVKHLKSEHPELYEHFKK